MSVSRTGTIIWKTTSSVPENDSVILVVYHDIVWAGMFFNGRVSLYYGTTEKIGKAVSFLHCTYWCEFPQSP